MITVYTQPRCPYCERAKEWLDQNGIEYQTVDVKADAEALAFIKGRGHQTVPQFYKGEELLVGRDGEEGGYTGLRKLGLTAFLERIG